MSGIYVAQLLGVLLTFAASGLTALNARSANNNARLANQSQEDVAHRTTSLTELEAALTFTGTQLKDLRALVIDQGGQLRDQSAQIRQLRTLHEECEADKFRLHMQLAELRGHM